MLSLANSIKQIVKQFGQFAGVEDCNWSCEFRNLSDLSSQSNLAAINTLCRLYSEKNRQAQISALVRILYLINTDAVFTPEDYEKMFFAATRLYECGLTRVTRLNNLLMGYIAPRTEHAFMLQALEEGDLKHQNPWVQAHAFKTLARANGINQLLESILPNALVSGKSYLIQTALCSCTEVVSSDASQVEQLKKYYQNISSCLNEDATTAASALLLLHVMYQREPNQLVRIVQGTRSRSPLVIMRLVSIMKGLLLSSIPYEVRQKLLATCLDYLNNEHSMVVLEVGSAVISIAHAILANTCALDIESLRLRELTRRLACELGDASVPIRYAAIMKIYAIGQINAAYVKPYGESLERCAYDSNTNVAVRALLTLLLCDPTRDKRGVLVRISDRVYELSETMKIELISGLCGLDFVDRDIIDFLLAQVKEGEGQASKLYTGIRLCQLCENNVKEPKLFDFTIEALCELIEDCCHRQLLCYLINFLTRHIPRTAEPIKKVRYIINRLTLEADFIRLTSVDALLRISRDIPEVATDIAVVLEGYTAFDADDEIREFGSNVSRLCRGEIVSPEFSPEFDMENLDVSKIDFADVSSIASTYADSCSSEIVDLSVSIPTATQSNDLSAAALPNEGLIKSIFPTEHLAELQYTCVPITISKVGDNITAVCSIHQFWAGSGSIVLQIDVHNECDYIEYRNLNTIMKASQDSVYEYTAVNSSNLSLEPDSSATIWILARSTGSLDELTQTSVQTVALSLQYTVHEDHAFVGYEEKQELNSILLGLSAITTPMVVSPNTVLPHTKQTNLTSTRLKTVADVVDAFRKGSNLICTDDSEYSGRVQFSGKLTINNSPIRGTFHAVNNGRMTLVKCLVEAETENASTIVSNYLRPIIV